jgi:hypothetical protein
MGCVAIGIIFVPIILGAIFFPEDSNAMAIFIFSCFATEIIFTIFIKFKSKKMVIPGNYVSKNNSKNYKSNPLPPHRYRRQFRRLFK